MVEMMMYSMSQKDEDDDNISIGDFTSEGGSEVGEADDEDMDSEVDSEYEDPEFEDEDIDSENEGFYLKEEAELEKKKLTYRCKLLPSHLESILTLPILQTNLNLYSAVTTELAFQN